MLKTLIRQFSNLSLKNQIKKDLPKRVLVGYGDTEGMPGKNECWNSAILFTDIIDIKDNKKSQKDLFHVLHYGFEKYNKDCKHALENHVMTIDYIQKIHKCDSVVIFYWNASHDKRVVQNYMEIPDRIHFYDMLNPIRKKTKQKYNSYKLDKLCAEIGIFVQQKPHSALGDTLRLQQVVTHFDMNLRNTIINFFLQ